MDVVEPYQISLNAFLRGVIRPMSRSDALDPFAFKTLPKHGLRRIVWTAESRVLQALAKLTYERNISIIRELNVKHRFSERGFPIPDTAVTSRQRDLLLEALGACDSVRGDIAEIGSYRGATTSAFARATAKTVYAIDPFIGYGGAEDDLQLFSRTCASMENIKHIRKTSGDASQDFGPNSLAFVFIDGVHDFSNSWFDFSTWSGKVARGGLIALHDVDDHVGATMTCRRVCLDKDFAAWAYCPNLIIFERI